MRALLVAAALVAAPVLAAAQECGPFVGDVLPLHSSRVNARTIGNVAEVAVKEGQAVEQGQVLARLDDTVQRAAYNVALFNSKNDSEVKAAEVMLKKSELELERTKKTTLAASPMDIDNATYTRDLAAATLEVKRQELAQAAANLKSWEASLEQYVIRAPFKGVVARQVIEVGESTAPVERVLFEVIDCSKVYVTVTVPVAVAARLEAGSPASVAMDCLSGETFEGRVDFVAPSLVPGADLVQVKVLVDNAENRLRPWMKAQVTFGAPAGPAAEAAQPAVAPAAPAPEVVVSK